MLLRLALAWRVMDSVRIRQTMPARVLADWVRHEADLWPLRGGVLPFPQKQEPEPLRFTDPWEIAEAFKAWGRGELCWRFVPKRNHSASPSQAKTPLR